MCQNQNGDLYVPDLGSDRIWQLKRKGENELEITGAADGRSGVGPRHAALHSNGMLCVLQSHDYD
jgi:6-phosphogluconolactonase (cycloisomerase 2 family)